MSDLKKPDLSKDTTGPFVTRDAGPVDYVGKLSDNRFLFRFPDGELVDVNCEGDRPGYPESPLDIFLAPKEPKTVLVPWFAGGFTGRAGDRRFPAATLQLEVDDQGVPVHGSTVRRVGL